MYVYTTLDIKMIHTEPMNFYMNNNLLYIMSPSYSGSTLLTFLLANHPAIATIGELKASALGDVNSYLCSCGARITDCQFWGKVTTEMRARGKTFGLEQFGTHFRTKRPSLTDRILRATVRGDQFELLRAMAINLVPGCKSFRDNILQQNKMVIEVVKKLQNAEYYLDGSKDPIRFKHFYDSGIWDIKVISLIRDGRGVTNSYMNHVGVSMEVAAKEWLKKCEEMENALRHIPEKNIINLKYEDLCRDTQNCLESILDFAGIDAKDMPEDYRINTHHILGNSMRLQSSGEVRLDEKWRSMLSNENMQIFENIGGDMNARFGYV